MTDRTSGGGQVEELAAAAVKEEGIEVKLAALTAQWAVLSLTFLDYKTRGPVLLKVRSPPAQALFAFGYAKSMPKYPDFFT